MCFTRKLRKLPQSDLHQSTSVATSIQSTLELSSSVSAALVAESAVNDAGVSSAVSESCEIDVLSETWNSLEKLEANAGSDGKEVSGILEKPGNFEFCLEISVKHVFVLVQKRRAFTSDKNYLGFFFYFFQ
jgi:hypothetical protein